ncbi:MAG: hypothetical protein LBE34_04170 [Flavobacteriaceae bacterium]|jgi:hypothetical protein|nr:hypothetical protein [Flavobacteriaceae bacterium]
MLRLSILFLSISFTLVAFTQNSSIYSSAYRPYSLNEKNLIRINTQEQDSIQYLIPYKDLLKETTTYFKAYIPSLLPFKEIEIIENQNHYYLVQHNKTHTVISYLHPTIRPDITDAIFLILGSNHCIVPINHPLCYPGLQPHTCIMKQPYCEKLDTKR